VEKTERGDDFHAFVEEPQAVRTTYSARPLDRAKACPSLSKPRLLEEHRKGESGELKNSAPEITPQLPQTRSSGLLRSRIAAARAVSALC